MAEFKGFSEFFRKKMKKRREQKKAEETGRPRDYDKMSDSDKRRWEAVDRANKKRKMKKY